MSDDTDLVATPSQTVGPFFHFGVTTPLGRSGAASAGGDRVHVTVSVLDGDGAPLDDALVVFWHRTSGGGLAECGRAQTDKTGTCAIETVQPAGHINVCLFARGLLRHLYTRIYFPDSPANDGDPVLALVPAGRRPTLFARPDGHGHWQFDIHLQGPVETVFFDQ